MGETKAHACVNIFRPRAEVWNRDGGGTQKGGTATFGTCAIGTHETLGPIFGRQYRSTRWPLFRQAFRGSTRARASWGEACGASQNAPLSGPYFALPMGHQFLAAIVQSTLNSSALAKTNSVKAILHSDTRDSPPRQATGGAVWHGGKRFVP